MNITPPLGPTTSPGAPKSNERGYRVAVIRRPSLLKQDSSQNVNPSYGRFLEWERGQLRAPI